MESQPIPNPLQVYLETTVIIDLCLKGELRHGDAEELVEIFESHQSPQKRVDVYVSPWARMEAHSRIYEKLLEQREGITRESYFRSSKGEKEKGKPPREIFPPIEVWLKEATSLVNQVFAELESRTVLHNSLPDAKMWNIANQLAEEAAIYPLDSIHVATAIHWGCSLFIATDRDLLDKINRYDATIQQLFRESLHLDLTPAFEVVPLTGILRMYPPKTPGDAIDWLKAHGFD